MSNYDPFRLYDYKQKKSHKGQVIRKKFVGNPLPTVLTPEQLKEAKEILEGIGYSVTKNPIIPGPTNETRSRSHVYCDQFNNYQFDAGNHILNLSDVWNSKILDFQDLFVQSDRVNSFNFEINVISYQLSGPFISEMNEPDLPIVLRLYDITGNYSSLNILAYTDFRAGGFSFFAANPDQVILSGALVASNNSYDCVQYNFFNRDLTYPFLYHHFDNTIETYNSLVTSDFTNYNPILMNIGVVVPQQIEGTTVTVSNLFVTYQITMTINTDI